MNHLVEHGIITEMLCGSNFSFIIENDAEVLRTEYKFVQSKTDLFVRCLKMRCNGKPQIYYLTDNSKPLSSAVLSLRSDEFLTAAKNILHGILELNNTGFLTCQSLDVDLKHIFVEPNSQKIKFVYIPISVRNFSDDFQFESELRHLLMKLIETTPNIVSADVIKLASELGNPDLSLNKIAEGLDGEHVNQLDHSVEKEVRCRLVSLEAAHPGELIVNKQEYLIGRKKGFVDGLIAYNGMIGRMHAKMLQNAGNFLLLDLNSQNGTFLNGERLIPNKAYPIKNGDMIAFATSSFKVVIQ